MFVGILVILALLHVVSYLTQAMGFFQPEWSYSFEKDVLKPLGYTAVHYHVKNDITCILKVQKKLNQVFLDHLSSNDWHMIQRDINQNQRMEEAFIQSLKK